MPSKNMTGSPTQRSVMNNMVTLPQNMDDLIYFTKRAVGTGHVMAWVYRGECPKCHKGQMGKPRDPKTGKPKIRATTYECMDCGHSIPKQAYEDTLQCEAKYTCPHCKKSGEISVPFKRKKMQVFDEETQKKVSVDTIRFACGFCTKPIDITKKMKK